MQSVDAMTQAALMVAVQRGQEGRRVEQPVARALDQLDKQVVDGIMSKLDKQQGLLPQEAIQAWQQLWANRAVRRQLLREQRVGVAAAVAMKPQLDGQQ